MRALLRLVLLAAGVAGLVVTFREETKSRTELVERQGIESRVFRERTEIGLAFSPWYTRATDTGQKPVVEEKLDLLSWSAVAFFLSLALLWLSFRSERRARTAQAEDATW